MRHLRPPLPYALVSALVSAASVAAVVLTAPTGGVRDAIPSRSPTAAPTLAGSGLSDTDRLAYWRAAGDGRQELWASDLDGARRRVIVTEPKGIAIALTRWSPSGEAIAYAVGGTRLAVAPLAGPTVRIALPPSLGTGTWTIVALAWSPDSSRVAVTLRAGAGVGNERRVFIVAPRVGGVWDPVAVPADAVAGSWIDDTRLFIETASRTVGVFDLAHGSLRPLTAMPAVSPLAGRDGRVYFVGGQATAADVLSTFPSTTGWIWSATVDGGEARRVAPGAAAFAQPTRLADMLDDGEPVVLSLGRVLVLGDRVAEISSPSGAVLRATVASDGRRVVARTASRILVANVSGPSASSASAGILPSTVLVGDVIDADAWAARRVAPLASAPPDPAGRGRFAFVLGRTLWTWSPPAAPVALALDVVVGPPTWSPRGDRIATTLYQIDPLGPSTHPVLIPPDGGGRVDLDTGGLGGFALTYGARGIAWTPGGDVAVHLARGDRTLQFVTRLYDPSTGAVRDTIPGRVAWAGGREVVLTDGDLDNDTGDRVEQQVIVRDGAKERVLTDARRIAAGPLLAGLPDREQAPAIGDIEPTGDPGLLAVWFQRQRFGGYSSAALVVVRVADGGAVWILPFSPQDPPADVAFAPAGPFVGWTVHRAQAAPAADPLATVVDVTTDRVVRTVAGRFAGWSPDGTTYYVARNEGLFAYPIAGGDPAYVGPFGVPVAAAP